MTISWRFVLFGVALVMSDISGAVAREEPQVFAANELWSKGHFGLVDCEPNIYINVKSQRNELRLSDGSVWVGRDAGIAEVVFFLNGRVLSAENLPGNFDLARATVISFEKERVRFLDLSRMYGGYYRRKPQVGDPVRE